MQFAQLKRREFIAMIGGAAGWPLAARGQPAVPAPLVGVISGADIAETDGSVAAFLGGLEQLGWTNGRNIRLDIRRGGGDPDRIRRHATELALASTVILANGTVTMEALLRATQDVPIVFVNVADPVGAGFVNSLSRPGANATGFVQFEYSLSGKWLELLREISPRITRAAVLRDAAITSGIGQFAVIQAVAPSTGIAVTPVNLRDAGEIERAITAFARSENGGLIVTGSALSAVHRDLILALAARYKLPAIYYRRLHVVAGGLISYGPDIIDQFRRAAGYVNRILKGERPGDLPVQTPNRYELVINLKTAKALGLDVPPQLLARADEVIEH
jgi:putative ABC transport system substrate-binding protein